MGHASHESDLLPTRFRIASSANIYGSWAAAGERSMDRARVMDPRGATARSWRNSSVSSTYIGAIYPLFIQLSRINRESGSLFLRLPQRKILVGILLIQQ